MHLSARHTISILAAMAEAGHAADLGDLDCGTLVAVCLADHAPFVEHARGVGDVRVVALDDLGARGTPRELAARWAAIIGVDASDVYVASVRA